MATPGIKLDIKQSEILDALRENNGIIRRAARQLNISPDTLYRVIYSDPKYEEALEEYRKVYHQIKLDNSELTIDAILANMPSRPDLSLRAAMYNLDRLGKKRGYETGKVPQNDTKLKDHFEKFDTDQKDQYEEAE